jgi:HAD superfamily hydrolase (TIGR01509 family)
MPFPPSRSRAGGCYHAPPMALDAIIFDVDGTLLDTNALHVEAFRRAFDAHGYQVLPDRIAVEMGKGGDTLVPSILGRVADQRDGDAIRGDQPKRFAELAQRQGLPVFPGARELLAAVRRRGLQVVIATSSGQKQIDSIETFSGWAFTGDADVVVKADDASTSKPAPDLVAAAVARTGLSPAQCAMIGDTPYDAAAAKGAGVITLGVTCGGNPAAVLLAAGARRVYQGPADLLAQLDEAVAVASPAVAHLTRSTLEFLMGEALAAARDGMADGELPVGCVLARGDGSVAARGWHRARRAGDRSAHAEMVTLAAAAGQVPADARDLILVTTLEPCVMCVGAAMELAIDTVVFAVRSPANGGVGRVTPPTSPGPQMPRFVGNVRAAESATLLRGWHEMHAGGRGDSVAFVEQLLRSTESH